jgi:hypothetical protein
VGGRVGGGADLPESPKPPTKPMSSSPLYGGLNRTLCEGLNITCM